MNEKAKSDIWRVHKHVAVAIVCFLSDMKILGLLEDWQTKATHIINIETHLHNDLSGGFSEARALPNLNAFKGE